MIDLILIQLLKGTQKLNKIIFIFLFALIPLLPNVDASCMATFPPQPCFDNFSTFVDGPALTETSLMEQLARNLDLNYGDWQMSDRNWAHVDSELELPATICTEFIADNMKQYRILKWVDSHTTSSWENHYNPSLCDKWLPPIDDGIKVTWDKEHYESDDIGIVTVIDKSMNLNNQAIDSFDIHVWSDTDHKGIQLRITETDENSGIFKGTAYFTIKDESSGARLLVEDRVNAEHKLNRDHSRIIYEPYVEPVCIPPEVLHDDYCVEIHSKPIFTDYNGTSYGFYLIIPGVIAAIPLSLLWYKKRKNE
jgi:hypothetical protein